MMMMSMFSSFDALCADFYGEKVRFAAEGSPAESAKVEKVSISTSEPVKKEVKGKASPPDSSVKKPQPLRRVPRFAPELDGVHCFETIVPY